MFMTHVKEMLSDSDSSETKSKSRKRKKTGLLTKLSVVGLILITLLGTGLYFSRHWLAERTEALIKKELDARGLFLDYHEVSYSWDRGLIIKGFTLFNEVERKNPLIVVTDVAARIELGELLSDGRAVGVFTAEESDVIFYGENEVKLAGFDTEIYLSHEGLEIRDSSGNLEGLDLDISGNLAWGERYALHEEPEPEQPVEGKAALDFSFMDDVATWFAVQTDGDAPQLKLRIEGDLSKIAMAGQSLAADGVGGETGTDPASALDGFKAIGEFRGEKFSWRGLPLEGMEVKFTAMGGEVKAESIVCRHGEGEISLNARIGLDGIVRTEGTTSGIRFFDVIEHLPFESVTLPEGYLLPGSPDIAWKAEFPVSSPLDGELEASIVSPGIVVPLGDKELELTDLKGTVVLREGVLAVDGFTGTMQSGAKIKVSGSGNYGLQNGNLDLTEILLEHGEGKMEAKVSWNQANGKLVTRGTSTGLDVFEVNAALPFSLPLTLPDGVTVLGVPDLGWDAVVYSREPEKNKIDISVQGDAGLSVPYGEKQVLVRPLTGTVSMEGGLLSSDDTEFGVFGGTGGLKFRANSGSENASVALAIGGLPVQNLADFFAEEPLEEPVPGILSGTYSGVLSPDIKAIQGSGNISIQDAEIYTFPVLGPINLMLGDLAPSFTKDEANNLTADYSISDGIVSTENLVAESSLTRVKVKGTMDLSDSSLDLTVNANLKGVVGVATAIASKLFEVEVTGTVSNPDISLKHNPLSGVGEVAGNVTNGVKEGVKGVGKVTGKVVGTVAEGVGDVAGQVGKGVGAVGKGVGAVGKGAIDKVGGAIKKLPLIGKKDDEEEPDSKPEQPVVIPEVIDDPEPEEKEKPEVPEKPEKKVVPKKPIVPEVIEEPKEPTEATTPKWKRPVVPEVIEEPKEESPKPIVPEVIEEPSTN